MTKNDDFKTLDRPTSLANLAYIRDGKTIYTGAEVIYLATLLRASGGKRDEKKERRLAALMNDPNLDA